jgi:hypothetical protein
MALWQKRVSPQNALKWVDGGAEQLHCAAQKTGKKEEAVKGQKGVERRRRRRRRRKGGTNDAENGSKSLFKKATKTRDKNKGRSEDAFVFAWSTCTMGEHEVD